MASYSIPLENVYTYSFDSMWRPTSLVDNQGTPVTWAQSVQYNAAYQMTLNTAYGTNASAVLAQYPAPVRRV
jgi:hypothetical protein